ncbi:MULTISPECIES: hypothetical protein [Glutamicibacter]|uniref:hypothetical protein n=1 Tax=Glutamicibacter TaxID=1742989 RepID=UPI00167FAD02|nr:hypothetical protein [Glutamicibacter nicotianae]
MSAGNKNTMSVHQSNLVAGDFPGLFADLKNALSAMDLSDTDRSRHLGQLELLEEEFEDEKDEDRASKGLKRFLGKASPVVRENLTHLVPALATVVAGALGG